MLEMKISKELEEEANSQNHTAALAHQETRSLPLLQSRCQTHTHPFAPGAHHLDVI